MPSLMLLVSAVEVFSLPFIAISAIALSKLTHGETARTAERGFLGVLLAVTLITCRTVICVDPCWLVHTATLGLMIVAALLLPNRAAFEGRRVAADWQ